MESLRKNRSCILTAATLTLCGVLIVGAVMDLLENDCHKTCRQLCELELSK